MTGNRREMIKMLALSGLSITGSGIASGFPAGDFPFVSPEGTADTTSAGELSVIGAYGRPVTEWKNRSLPSLSFRRSEFSDIDTWRRSARENLLKRMGVPELGPAPAATIKKQYEYDGLHIEEISWQLSYGPPTDAIVLRPASIDKPLPAVLAFHDHSGDKYFGARKITKTSDTQHPLMVGHQQKMYQGEAWANRLAKRGYVVLVPDAFAFASRRVLLSDVPEEMRKGLSDNDPENPANIKAYNEWASDHEPILAKSLFSAGTSWPAMFFAEDKVALDILCARKDVDTANVGCGGLSGGGIRTVYMGGLDPRIRCAITMGFMTTWDDFALNKSINHTWMTYVPILPKELDFPEILALRVPLPVMALNNNEDSLFTLAEMKKAETVMADVYKKAGAADHFRCSFHPGPHKFDRSMQSEAFDWFDKWLK